MIKITEDLTKTQIDLARHAIGLSKQSEISWRNHFVCSKGSPDHAEWNALVDKGFAKVRRGYPLRPSADCFWLTSIGAKAVLKRGEKLSKEDFSDEE
jgi:hypothetical protein